MCFLCNLRQPEPQILDYQTQQYKLLPQIATIFGIHFSARRVWDTYNEVTGNIQEGNLDLLPEVSVWEAKLMQQYYRLLISLEVASFNKLLW